MAAQPFAMSRAIPSGSRGGWLATAVAATSLVVYLATLAPGLTFEHYGTDGGDLIAAARTLGVPHPTGYPTYTLLAWLFSNLPVGNVAYRVNLMSAASAATAVGLFCRSAQLLLPAGQHVLPLSAATALMLAFSPLYWSQAVISEVYALLAFFAALLLWLLARWRRERPVWILWLAALSLGLGLGNHVTLIFAMPAVLVLWLVEPGSARRPWFRTRILIPALGFLLAGLAVYAYLPLAAAHRPPVNWGDPRTWNQFLWVVTGKQYQSFAFGLPGAEISDRLGDWARLLGDQFGWWGLAICLAGFCWWWRRDRPFALFTLIWILLAGVYAFFYDTYDSHTYLLPVVMVLALWWGEGASYLLRLAGHFGPGWERLALVFVLALPLLSLVVHWQAADLSEEWSAHAYVYQALDGVAPTGLVVVRGDGPTFALWYGVYAEGLRPDVAVVSGPLLAYHWYRVNMRDLYPDLILNEPRTADLTTDDLVRDLIIQNLPNRPIYATDPGEAWREWFDFVEEGDAPIYRVEPGRGLSLEGMKAPIPGRQGARQAARVLESVIQETPVFPADIHIGLTDQGM